MFFLEKIEDDLEKEVHTPSFFGVVAAPQSHAQHATLSHGHVINLSGHISIEAILNLLTAHACESPSKRIDNPRALC